VSSDESLMNPSDQVERLIERIKAGETITYDSFPYTWLNDLCNAYLGASFDFDDAIANFINNPTEENKVKILESLNNFLKIWQEIEDEEEAEE
jgi:hypothetical protein